jgi:hypothetical protein
MFTSDSASTDPDAVHAERSVDVSIVKNAPGSAAKVSRYSSAVGEAETTVPEGPFHSNQHPFRSFFRVEISILNP